MGNIQRAEAAAFELAKAGFAPYVPHSLARNAESWKIPHSVWLSIDEPWVRAADVLLRLPGDSIGGDMEVSWADEEGIPVYWSIEALLAGMAP